MLKKIYIDNFRQFKNFELELKEQTTLLCGLNGTGKTTVLEVLSRLQRFLVLGENVISLCNRNDIPRWENKEFGSYSMYFKFNFMLSDNEYSYEIQIGTDLKNNLFRVETEKLFYNTQMLVKADSGTVTTTTDDNKELIYPIDWGLSVLQLTSRTNSKIRNFLTYIAKNLYVLSIEPSAFHLPTALISSSMLSFNASNFSTWYEEIIKENLASIARSFEYLKPAIKGFKQLSPISDFMGNYLYMDMVHVNNQTYRLQFNELSHGQQILCILYTVLSICPENSIICIDEIENYLSPVELQPLYNLIQDIYEEKNVQCILISHHQKTMNWFKDCAIILSHSYDNSFIEAKDFSEESGISIEDYLLNTSEN